MTVRVREIRPGLVPRCNGSSTSPYHQFRTLPTQMEYEVHDKPHGKPKEVRPSELPLHHQEG